MNCENLERVKLNQRIGMDASPTEVEPPNPKPRSDLTTPLKPLRVSYERIDL